MNLGIKPLGDTALEQGVSLPCSRLRLLNVLDTLETPDYDAYNDMVEDRIARHGCVNLLMLVRNFRGWTPAALWEDMKFNAAHYRDVARFAVVGEGYDDQWMATVSRPFTGADVEYFSEWELERARGWVQQQPSMAAGSAA